MTQVVEQSLEVDLDSLATEPATVEIISEPTAKPRKPEFRLYVDEVGHATIKATMTEEERYLSLIGVACRLQHIHEVLKPDMETIKDRYFRRPALPGEPPDPDEPRPIVIFHRREMAGRLYPFDVLKDREINRKFDVELLSLLETWEYTVFSVVVDKQMLRDQYDKPAHPYHYALEALLESYVVWLDERKGIGDVLAESRGRKDDRELTTEFKRIYRNGSQNANAGLFSACISSRTLKIRGKQEDVAGLQLTEMLAQPCHKAALASEGVIPLVSSFNGKVAAILEAGKYCAGNLGETKGHGRKWLPQKD